MGLKAHNFVGAKGPVYLPDWIKVDIRIIDHPRFNSRTHFTGQRFTVWHDTGNPGTTAEGEYTWAAGGRQGGSVGGYSFIYDDDQIIQTQQLDRVTWAQGDEDGNRLGWAAEQAWGGGVNFQKSLEVGAALHGGLCAMMGWPVDSHLVKHQYWTGKWCPGQILNRNLWSTVVKMTSDAARAATVAAAGGDAGVGGSVYATPVAIPELEAYKGKPDAEIPYRVNGDGWVALYVGDRVRATRETPRLRYSTGDAVVGPNIHKGEEFDVDWLVISVDFPDTYYSPWATRIRAGDTERISDVKAA